MARFSYVDIISAVEDEETINLIGKIDLDILNSQIVESLYYMFPLIERLVLEIYKLIPDADVEHYEQGIMKTLLSIIKNNKMNVIPDKTIDILVKYYDDDCLRNELFHIQKDVINITVSFDELNFVIMQLISILKRLLKENDCNNFEDIQYL